MVSSSVHVDASLADSGKGRLDAVALFPSPSERLASDGRADALPCSGDYPSFLGLLLLRILIVCRRLPGDFERADGSDGIERWSGVDGGRSVGDVGVGNDTGLERHGGGGSERSGRSGELARRRRKGSGNRSEGARVLADQELGGSSSVVDLGLEGKG
jgi:hypothetical protein